jgi:hypothetical protein
MLGERRDEFVLVARQPVPADADANRCRPRNRQLELLIPRLARGKLPAVEIRGVNPEHGVVPVAGHPDRSAARRDVRQGAATEVDGTNHLGGARIDRHEPATVGRYPHSLPRDHDVPRAIRQPQAPLQSEAPRIEAVQIAGVLVRDPQLARACGDRHRTNPVPEARQRQPHSSDQVQVWVEPGYAAVAGVRDEDTLRSRGQINALSDHVPIDPTRQSSTGLLARRGIQLDQLAPQHPPHRCGPIRDRPARSRIVVGLNDLGLVDVDLDKAARCKPDLSVPDRQMPDPCRVAKVDRVASGTGGGIEPDQLGPCTVARCPARAQRQQ